MKTLKLTVVIFLIAVSFARGSNEPYTIELQSYPMPGAPAIHSFAFAKWGGKWLFLGGRTNGMHGFNPNNAFPKQFSNTNIFVVDPVTLQIWSRNIFVDLPLEVADQLRSTNMQYYQSGNKLYMVGGYGYDSTLNSNVTFPLIKVINVEGIIQSVINGTSVAQHISQIEDDRMKVCGAELYGIGEDLFLVGGHIFTGEYSQTQNDQVYVNQIRKFKISESAGEVSIVDYYAWTDTVEYHRRDMNLVPALRPDGVNPYLILYGGVFKSNVDLPFLNPIYIDGSGGTVDYTFEQKMSQYTCSYMSAFDTQSGNMHTTFFGGTSLYSYYESIDSLVYDSLVPFINDITTLTRESDGSSHEVISETRFQYLLGTNAKFIIDENIPQYDRSIIKLSQLSGRTFAGYIFGGIRALLPNNTPTYPSQYVYKVFITPKSVSVNQIAGQIPDLYEIDQNYPNPFNPITTIRFKLPESGNVRLNVFDGLGRLVTNLINKKLNAGSFEVKWNGDAFASGIYFYRLEAGSFISTKKMILTK